MKPVILVHGGAAALAIHADGPAAAAEAALARLAEPGASALDAAILAAVRMEDDPRFNAGTGSNLRLDGRTIEMDASVMTSDGAFGAVMALQRTKNPILVAAAVADTPHLMLAGEGALRLARRLGHADYDPTTPKAVDKHRRALERLAAARGSAGNPNDRDPGAAGHTVDRTSANPSAESPAAWDGHPGWLEVDPAEWWNFPDEFRAGDTIGAVVRDAAGRFAVTNSTGGTSIMLLGRVGDSPIFGAGLYAGPHGAVAATGEGEEIVRRMACLRIYDRMAAGDSARAAGRAVLAEFPQAIVVGFIVAGRTDCWAGSNREMPYAILEGEA